MTQGAHIVATAVRCAVGLTAESSAAAIRAGISRVAEHPFMVDAAGDPLSCARDPRIDATVLGAERLVVMAEHALREVLAKLTRSGAARAPIPVLLALPEPRPGFTAEHAAWLQQRLTARALPFIGEIVVQQVGVGHAGALSALRLAVERIRDGRDELCIAGGVDGYFDADTLDWLESELRLARADVRSGFSPGEGAAMLAVCSDAACAQLRLSPLARVRDVACTFEQRDPKSDAGLLGEALTEAVAVATNGLRPPHELISDVYGDINGERARTEDWGFALLRTAERFRDGTAYVSAVGECGDVGAATGALGCVLAVQAWQRRYANGPRALVWAGSWSGLRGAALLEQGSA
jgi:3-oxoacyl-[acyl-carrier-protein] synthase-1